MLAVPKMVAISPCMKAQGTEDPARGHRSPLGQYTCKHKAKHQYTVANVAQNSRLSALDRESQCVSLKVQHFSNYQVYYQ